METITVRLLTFGKLWLPCLLTLLVFLHQGLCMYREVIGGIHLFLQYLFILLSFLSKQVLVLFKRNEGVALGCCFLCDNGGWDTRL